MIRFYQHNEIDSIQWNRCIEHSSFPTVFADYDLLSLVSPGWCALIEGDYEAVMPLPSRCKWGVSYVFTPFFISRLGLFAAPAPSAEKMLEFVKALPQHYRQCDLCLNTDNDVSMLPSDSYMMMVSHGLDLNFSYEALQANYAENTRRNIKAADKFALSLTTAEISQIVDLFVHNRGKQGVGFKKADYEMLVSMVDFWNQRNLVDLVGVKDENGKLIAGACFLKDHQRRWFLFSGRDNAESDKRAMFYLIDEYIKQHAGANLILDFNGSMNPNVARFYAGFGAQRYEFPVLDYTRNSFWAPLIRCYRRWRS